MLEFICLKKNNRTMFEIAALKSSLSIFSLKPEFILHLSKTKNDCFLFGRVSLPHDCKPIRH